MIQKHWRKLAALFLLIAAAALAQQFQPSGQAFSNVTVIAGTDGTLARPFATDAGGRLTTVADANGANIFTCTVTLSTNTTTQCQAAPGAGLRAYVTDFQLNTTAAGTATTISLRYGTGSNCGTGTTNLTAINYPNTGVGLTSILGVRTPLVPAVANAICAIQAGTTPGTTVVEIRGFIAP